MKASNFGPMRWQPTWAFGTNPLVRISDRIEAIVLVSAIVTSLLAASIAGAIGTAVYDQRSRIYAEEAQALRPVSAIVTKTRRGASVVAHPSSDSVIVEARWRLEGVGHTDSFSAKNSVTVGDRIDIWVNDKGERVEPPSSFQAVFEAVCVAVAFWVVVIGVAGALVALVRRLLDRHRAIDWEREIEGLVGRR